MIREVVQTLSAERFGTYLTAAGHDRERAQKLYLWNAHMGEAFHTPIQAVEVALRNGINKALIIKYGKDWWRNQALLKILDIEREFDLTTVQKRIRNRNLPLINGQIVAGLSFGFWVGMLRKRYNPDIWSSHLRVSFPNLPPTENRDSLLRAASLVALLRNRISHHEPIFKRNVSADYADMMALLNWICPATHDWIRPHCQTPIVIRRKP